jgi:hypothetical protein
MNLENTTLPCSAFTPDSATTTYNLSSTTTTTTTSSICHLATNNTNTSTTCCPTVASGPWLKVEPYTLATSTNRY